MYSLGYRKDPKDLRDIPMGMVLPAISLPGSFDYTAKMTPVRDQANEGTCVAFATVVGVKEYQDTKEYRKEDVGKIRHLRRKVLALSSLSAG